jgi:hypothetical protein
LSNQLVVFLSRLVALLVSEEMPDEKKPVNESEHLSPDKKHGKIKLKVYGKETKALGFDRSRFVDMF